MKAIFEKHGADVAFFLVYIREAHAIDSRSPTSFGMVEDPITDAERATVAGTCIKDLHLPMPALIDRVDDKVGKAYGGWPDRLYLVGTDGKIAYAGGQGPFNFDPDGWEQAIVAELAKANATKTGDGKSPPKKEIIR
ncbi:MAG: hypothetical protein KDC98_07785 [Planctomycetes bacterium]|nr:hypothetical protein [Planctomycetota bacterium]